MKNTIVKVIIPIVFLALIIVIIGPSCSGEDSFKWYEDADGDGYGEFVTNPIEDTYQPAGYVRNKTDCDDSNATVHPEATEIPDNLIDEDCNQKFAFTFYSDKDGDGFGSVSPIVMEIDDFETAPDDFSWYAGDCNDNDATIHPKADEIPNNGIDDNCDGETDVIEVYMDTDGDGYGSQHATAAQGVFNNIDCDDTDSDIHPYIKEGFNDAIDSNCDGNDNT